MRRVLKVTGLILAVLITALAAYYVSTAQLPVIVLFGIIVLIKYYPINVIITNAANIQFDYGDKNWTKYIPILQYKSRTNSTVLFIIFTVISVGYIISGAVGYFIGNAYAVIAAVVMYLITKLLKAIMDTRVERKLRELEGTEKLSLGKVLVKIIMLPMMMIPVLDTLPLLSISTLAFKFRRELEDE